MKKVLPIVIVVLIVAGLWYALSSEVEEQKPAASESAASSDVTQASPEGQTQQGTQAKAARPPTGDAGVNEEGQEGEEEAQIDERPAAERYKSAEEALNAVKAAAADYDDLVLDQFTQPGENCTWCPQFYASIKELMFAQDVKPDQKSYYAEILAISGNVDNVKTLVEAISQAKNQDEADIYAQALELSTGKDDVVRYLGQNLSSQNDTLREASLAAVTNQGSRLAVETIYNHTLEKGDPDGYYSLGIGLGEVVPDEEALPYLQELASKRDQYSHLAVKAMLNAGLDGLKLVMDTLASSKNADFDKEMLRGAKDHVAFDDDQMNFLRSIADSGKQGPAVDFAKEVLADYEQSAANEEEETTEAAPPAAPMSMMPPK